MSRTILISRADDAKDVDDASTSLPSLSAGIIVHIVIILLDTLASSSLSYHHHFRFCLKVPSLTPLPLLRSSQRIERHSKSRIGVDVETALDAALVVLLQLFDRRFERDFGYLGAVNAEMALLLRCRCSVFARAVAVAAFLVVAKLSLFHRYVVCFGSGFCCWPS